MDDYTWRLQLRARKISSYNRTLTMLVIVFFALAVGSVLWYFFIHARSPEYALAEIQEAAEKHDAEKFERYVNVSLSMGRIYDDLTRSLFAADTSLTNDERTEAVRFYQLIKPQVTAGMRTTLTGRIETGEWQKPGGLLQGRQLRIDFENLFERSLLKNITIVGLDSIDRDGATATAHVKAKDELTGTELTLLLAMEQAGDGHWQVSYIKNYRDCLDRLTPLLEKDVASYLEASAPIVEQYNKRFAKEQQRFHVLTDMPWDGTGLLSSAQKDGLKKLIRTEIIPTLKERQQKLSALSVPPGARYLSQLRAESTELSITAWEHFANALETDDFAEFDTAETVHKEALDIDAPRRSPAPHGPLQPAARNAVTPEKRECAPKNFLFGAHFP